MGQRLRVVSANLWNGKADAEAFAELVVGLAADVVAVQEMTPDQADALARAFPHGELEPDWHHHGMGIALQRPATHRKIALHRRPARVARLSPSDWPGLDRAVEIVNLHIAAPHVFRPYLGLAARRIQIRQLDAYLAASDGTPQVLVGDFNSTPLWPAYRRISAWSSDAAVAVARAQGRRTASTWGPWAGAPRLLRIDHGFVRGLRAEAFRVVEVAGSDHSAVVMDLSLP